jgi:hypothetical protein
MSGRLVPKYKLASTDDALEASWEPDPIKELNPRLKQIRKLSDGVPDIQDLDALHQSPNNTQRDYDTDGNNDVETSKTASLFPHMFVGMEKRGFNFFKSAPKIIDKIKGHELFEQAIDQAKGQAEQTAVDNVIEFGKDEIGRLRRKDKSLKKVGYVLEGHTEFQGLPIAIENDVGSVRKGVDKDGNPWETEMKFPYGYLKGTKGADGEEVDVYVGPNEDAENAYIVHQLKKDTGEYDEDKVMLGMNSKEEAKKGFLAHYNSKKFLGPIKEVPMERLVKLMNSQEKLVKISELELPFRVATVPGVSDKINSVLKDEGLLEKDTKETPIGFIRRILRRG